MIAGGKNILFMPWIEDLSKQREKIANSNVDYVFGHLQIGGCVSNGKGIKLNGDNMPQSKDFKKAQVYAGHIHLRQDFKNVHYVGIPYHKDRSDFGNITGITILDIKTGKTQFIENTFSPKYITSCVPHSVPPLIECIPISFLSLFSFLACLLYS